MNGLPWLIVFVVALSAMPPVTLRVWPGSVQMAPALVVFVMRAPRHDGNREACLEYDGPERRSSCWELHGIRSPQSWRIEWWVTVGGDYWATASILRQEADGRLNVYRDTRSFQVIGPGP